MVFPAGLRVPRPVAPEKSWNLPPWDKVSFYETERCVYYVLTKDLAMEEDIDFRFQKRIPVRGINQTGLNRSDFWMLPNGEAARYGVGGGEYHLGRILNPIASTILIHDPNKDRLERALIRAQHFDIIYLLDWMLYDAPVTLVEAALRGDDRSGR